MRCRLPNRRQAARAVTFALTALLAAAICAGAAGAAPRRHAAAGPREYGCPILPANNPLNRDISRAPVDPRSASYIASIGAGPHLHPDFGNNPGYGIPSRSSARTSRKVPIKFTAYGSESDPGPYPVPPTRRSRARGEEGDKHVLVLQEGCCRLYELY